jgi:two-component system nitrate/nitrite response regulator NarL
MVDAFRAGADGYILKEIGCDSLIESLRLIKLGEKVMPSELVRHLPQHSMAPNSSTEPEANLAELLSEREIETLRCLVLGYANKVIAYRLYISEATVKVHVKAVLRKLMVQNRTQAAIWAVNHGVVSAQMASITQPEAAPLNKIEVDDQALMLRSN